uniref:Putative secreted protein n=1 Tax=Amblyomma cajennense TaxID=34607 RepID=A0A023FCQ9_AMBCJ
MFAAAIICVTLAALITGDAHPQPDETQTPTVYDDPDCNPENGTHVYEKCTLRCDGDTLRPLNENETCYLQKAPTEYSASERSSSASYGRCVEGECVDPNNASTEQQPIP